MINFFTSKILAMRRRFGLVRFSPSGYLGLHLTMGVFILIGASWLFGSVAEDVMTGDPLTNIDKYIAEWLHQHRTPGVTVAMQVVTEFASPVWVTCVTVMAGFVLGWKRYWYRLLALVLAIPGGMVQVPLLKIAFHRSRPSFEGGFLIFQGYSFPSGHTMAATLLYGLLAVFAMQAFDGWCQRVCAVIGVFGMVLLVGFSRLYLGAHYLSDVLGAATAGAAWLALTLTAVDVLRRSHHCNIQPLR